MGKILFILGAGASVDSGLLSYRGPSGYYKEDAESTLSPYTPLDAVWEYLTPLYQQISTANPGPTYDLIAKIGKIYPGSAILTQNIDGLAHSTGLPVIEMHGTHKTMTCVLCKKNIPTNLADIRCIDSHCTGLCRPDIILFGESLDKRKVQDVYLQLKTKFDKVFIIGTSMRFPYLRDFITKAKRRGSHVIHVNPDPLYEVNVKGKETWYDCDAPYALQRFLPVPSQ